MGEKEKKENEEADRLEKEKKDKDEADRLEKEKKDKEEAKQLEKATKQMEDGDETEFICPDEKSVEEEIADGKLKEADKNETKKQQDAEEDIKDEVDGDVSITVDSVIPPNFIRQPNKDVTVRE